MNTNLEHAFSDSHTFEVFTAEFLLACIINGDYVDPRDVQTNLKAEKAKDHILKIMHEQ